MFEKQFYDGNRVLQSFCDFPLNERLRNLKNVQRSPSLVWFQYFKKKMCYSTHNVPVPYNVLAPNFLL